MSKLITWFVVAVVIIGGIWYFWNRSQGTPSSAASASSQTQGASQSGDTSDAALQQDSASIDTQLQSASADTDTAGSFNDAPVQQTE